jgi:hypothetical protein
LRRDKLGKIHFGQELERVGPVQIQDCGVVTDELKLLQAYLCMTNAVAGIAVITVSTVIGLVKGGARAMVRCADLAQR